MAIDTSGLITALYNGLVLRDPSATELAYWTEQMDLGVTTPVGLVLLGVTVPEFHQVTLRIAMMFEASFGRYATTEELMAWRLAYDHGLGLDGIGQSFILSNEFRENNPSITTTAERLQAMANSGLGRNATQAELDILVPMIEEGRLSYGAVLQAIVAENGRGVQVGLAMISAGVNGVAPEVASIDSLSSSVPAAINTLIEESHFYTPPSTDLSLVESGGQLVLSGPLALEMSLDLGAQTLTVDGVSQALSRGTLSAVVSVDATGLTGVGLLSFVGNSAPETYVAAPAGGSIRGAGGADELTGGAGEDRFVFEATAAANGVDVISNFELAAVDTLDFSAFLKVTKTGHIGLVDSESNGAVAWENGDVLVTIGYNLTTAADIAGLFGAGHAYAAPTTRGLAVVIATDIIGDASVWFVVNQLATTSISADEVAQVAVLGGISNLSTDFNFAAGSFA